MLAKIIPVVKLPSYDDFEVGEKVLVHTSSLTHTYQGKWYRAKIISKYTHHALVTFAEGQRECFKYYDLRKIY